MSLNIKNEETVRLVRELADQLHVSMTAAMRLLPHVPSWACTWAQAISQFLQAMHF